MNAKADDEKSPAVRKYPVILHPNFFRGCRSLLHSYTVSHRTVRQRKCTRSSLRHKREANTGGGLVYLVKWETKGKTCHTAFRGINTLIFPVWIKTMLPLWGWEQHLRADTVGNEWSCYMRTLKFTYTIYKGKYAHGGAWMQCFFSYIKIQCKQVNINVPSSRAVQLNLVSLLLPLKHPADYFPSEGRRVSLVVVFFLHSKPLVLSELSCVDMNVYVWHTKRGRELVRRAPWLPDLFM